MGGKSSPTPAPVAAAPATPGIMNPDYKKPGDTGTKIVTTPEKKPDGDTANPVYSNSLLGN